MSSYLRQIENSTDREIENEISLLANKRKDIDTKIELLKAALKDRKGSEIEQPTMQFIDDCSNRHHWGSF